MQMRVDVRHSDTFSQTEFEQIAAARAKIDYGMPAWSYEWAEKVWRAVVWSNRVPVSHVGIVERTVDAGGEPVRVGGISGVWTAEEHRGRGLATKAMEAAENYIRDGLNASFGLLVCREELIPFYERLGWREVEGPLTFDQQSGKVVWEQRIMVTAYLGAKWPIGAIDLRGLPW